IDREAMKQLLQGRAMPLGQSLPPLSPAFDPNLSTKQSYDLERAREEMRLAGYPNGLPEPVTIMIGKSPSALRMAQLWQQALARIGIEVRLRPVSFATYLEQTSKRHAVQASTSGWHMDFPDPSNIFEVLFSSKAIRDNHSSNRAFYSNPTLDRILEAAAAES